MVCSIVDGVEHGAGEVRRIEDPANLDQPAGHYVAAAPELAGLAVERAAASARSWARVPLSERLGLLAAGLEAIAGDGAELAAAITAENGKTLREARAEVEGALAEALWQLEHIRGRGWREPGPEGVGELWREPVGPTALITPWNFPLGTVLRKLVPALACGNTVCLKPSEHTPLTATSVVRAMHAAGLPAGALQLIHGEGAEVGPALVGHPALRAVSFTGSTRTGRWIESQAAGRNVRVQAEMGGKNALVLLEGGDLEDAVEATLRSGYGVAGQWCTSTSRLIVVGDQLEAALRRLEERVGELLVGPGGHEATTMGPLINPEAKERVEAALERAAADGCSVLRPGRAVMEPLPRGNWVWPAIVHSVPDGHPISTEELFGPVVCVQHCRDEQQALQLTNSTGYGLTFSVYGARGSASERFLEEVEAGVCHLNLPTSHRHHSLPFGGFGDSGSGEPECGEAAFQFFTRTKTVYRA